MKLVQSVLCTAILISIGVMLVSCGQGDRVDGDKVREYANAGLQLLQDTIRSTKTDELETIIERTIMEINNSIGDNES